MKKTLLQRSAIIAACAAAFVLGSCSQPEEARIDTVYSLDRPEVTAKAYPGMNVISWKPVTGAVDYYVTVYEEGEYVGNLNEWGAVDGCSAYHTSLVNGKNYTYYVEVKSNSNPSSNYKGVYAKNNRGEASVKAIVPPFSTKPLELPAYENGYKEGETKTVENDDFVVSPDNIKVAVNNGQMTVSFPTKAYLSYTVKSYNLDLPHDSKFDGIFSQTKNLYDSLDVSKTNNVFRKSSGTIKSAGKYQIVVLAKATNTYYVNEDEVIYKDLITIESLDVDENNDTGTVTAKYVLDDNKIANNTAVTNADNVARVSFAPAKKDGLNVPTAWYKVYRRVDGEYATEVIAAVKEDVERGVYYVDDKVPDVTKTYVYTVVLTDGTKYGTPKEATLNRPGEKMISGVYITYYTPTDPAEKKETTWYLNPYDAALKTGVTLTAYSWVKPVNWNGDVNVLADDIIAKGAKAELKPVGTTKNFTVTTTVEGDVYLLVKAELAGYSTTYFTEHSEVEFAE